MTRGIRRNLRGRLFGKWKVLEEADNLGRKTRWRCVCSCGTERVVLTENLMNGLSNSCGCQGRRQ
jgi:hypothetical protein